MSRARAVYDHPFHAQADNALIIDFVADPDRAGGRVAVELTAESAQRLVDSILAALESGQAEHDLELAAAG